MTWNMLHMARVLKDAGGVPAHGNQRSQWDAGCRCDYPNPDYRRFQQERISSKFDLNQAQ